MPSQRRWSISAVTCSQAASTRQTFCRRRSGRLPGTRVHTIRTPSPRRSPPRTQPPALAPRPPPRRHRRAQAPGAVRLVFPRGHRRLAFPCETGRNEAARGTARGKPNLIGVLESDSTQPAGSPPPPDCFPGAQRQGPYGVTGSTRPSSTPGRPRPPPVHRHHPRIPASPGWTARPPSGTLEPVTAPAGARAAHLSPATPADPPHPPRRPSFAGTPRRQDPSTALALVSPRGQIRSTRTLVPSSGSGSSYTRRTWTLPSAIVSSLWAFRSWPARRLPPPCELALPSRGTSTLLVP